MTNLTRIIDVAAGRKKAELVLKNAKIVNVFTEEIIDGDIAIIDGKIAGIGVYNGEKEYNCKGQYVIPGLIDGHMHMESTMVTMDEFCKLVLPCGTTTIIADPHEIANVCGTDGIDYILESSKEVPLNVYLALPSCVPATEFETSGAYLDAEVLKKYLNHPQVIGLGEMMNFPGVIQNDPRVIQKLEAFQEMSIDGHGPNLYGHDLNAYVSAGVKTDHECTQVSEMIEKMRLGMYVQIREGSAAKDLDTLIKGITDKNYRQALFCTDDKHPKEIIEQGHINFSVKQAISKGIEPIKAIQMATINAARCYNLKKLGAIAPGYLADLVIIDNLQEFNVTNVFKGGKHLLKEGNLEISLNKYKSDRVLNTVKLKDFNLENFKVKLQGSKVNVMKLLPQSLITEKVVRQVEVVNGEFIFNENQDVLKIVVLERHQYTGNIGIGFVEGFGLKSGAIGTTIGHDSHNIIIVGTNDKDICLAAKVIEEMQGGNVIIDQGKIIKKLPLPIAGLISDRPIDEVATNMEQMYRVAEELGVSKDIDAFMTLSFLSLPVIPNIKITDKGLFDTCKFAHIGIESVSQKA